MRLRDFPAVFLSYDEPMADRNWRDLSGKLTGAVRVHGVKGLDACHKAAAEAVPGDWVITIDADTRIEPQLAEAPVPRHLLTGDFRLDWPARNRVNGLWSGNGSVKLWPKTLLQEMRTHEAAADGALSLDHDIGGIRPGRSAQVTMPERLALTDPAETAFLAFRAGLREAVFLRVMAEEDAKRHGLADWRSDAATRLIAVWCSVGRHLLNGRWTLYGARLGTVWQDVWPDRDLRQLNDHDAIGRLWSEEVLPRFQRAAAGGDGNWNWPLLELDLRALAHDLGPGLALAEFDAAASAQVAAMAGLSSPVAAARLDGLGYRLMRTSGSAAQGGAEQDAAARALLETAAALDHPAAHDNLGRLHLRGRISGADPVRAAWHFRAAEALGNPFARDHLAAMAGDPVTEPALLSAPGAVLARDLPVVTAGPGLRRALGRVAGPLCLMLDPGVTLGPAANTHVPDPHWLSEGRSAGYLCRCAVTGLPRPRGIRLAAPERLITAPEALPDVILPVVLGLLPAPASAADALRGGVAAGAEDSPPTLVTLGRDAAFGDHWVLGTLHALVGEGLSAAEVRRLAAMEADALDPVIRSAALAVSRQTGVPVPVWSAAESRALKRMIPGVAARRFWIAAADALAGSGAAGEAGADMLKAAATAIWGLQPG